MFGAQILTTAGVVTSNSFLSSKLVGIQSLPGLYLETYSIDPLPGVPFGEVMLFPVVTSILATYLANFYAIEKDLVNTKIILTRQFGSTGNPSDAANLNLVYLL